MRRSETEDWSGLDHTANVPLGDFSSLLCSPTLVTGPIIGHIIDLLFSSVSLNINSILYIPGLMQVVVEKCIINSGSSLYLFFQQHTY